VIERTVKFRSIPSTTGRAFVKNALALGFLQRLDLCAGVLSVELDGFATSGISWSAKVLLSHGENTEETEFGADILGLLSLDLPELKIRKGFLAHANRQEPGSKLPRREWDRLVNQCNKMTSFTPESFVFIYAFNGVFMVPAVTVAHCVGPEDLHTLNPESTVRFYRRHLQCFIGDSRIDSATPEALAGLRYLTGLEVSGKAERTVMNE
jgi:hypothetical protein